MSPKFAKLKDGKVVKIMNKLQNVVTVEQFCKVAKEGNYSLLPLLTELIRRYRLTLEQQIKAEFL